MKENLQGNTEKHTHFHHYSNTVAKHIFIASFDPEGISRISFVQENRVVEAVIMASTVSWLLGGIERGFASWNYYYYYCYLGSYCYFHSNINFLQ